MTVAQQIKQSFDSGHGLQLQPAQVQELVEMFQAFTGQINAYAMRLDALQRLTQGVLAIQGGDSLMMGTDELETAQERYAGFDVETSEDGKFVTLTLIPEEELDAEVEEASLADPTAEGLVSEEPTSDSGDPAGEAASEDEPTSADQA